MKEGLAESFIISTLDKSLTGTRRTNCTGSLSKIQRQSNSQRCGYCSGGLDWKSFSIRGNTGGTRKILMADDVDIIKSRRSTGSILKPFLFAAMLDEGKILQRTLVPDVPTIINGFSPKNFSKEYDGAVPANKALIRSLNIPAVHMLRTYRYEKFHSLLKNMGMNTLDRSPDHYGLSLILGGAEGTLWDITGMYASMARTLNNYWEHPGKNRYNRSDFHPPHYIEPRHESDLNQGGSEGNLEATSWLSAAAIFQTFDALKEVYRPGEESGWRYFSSSKKIAWKTGTSFGFRDAWAVGVTPHYAVGVWVGNADGEGRPGLTGTDAAAPLMFDIFSQLKERFLVSSSRARDGKDYNLPSERLSKFYVVQRSRYCFCNTARTSECSLSVS